MYSVPKFKKGEKVVIKHQPNIGVCEVDNPREKTDMMRVGTSEPVGYYVILKMPAGNLAGYHEKNLEHAT